MNLRKRYLTYLALACVPALYGCLWENIHVDGTLKTSGSEQEEVNPSSTKEDDNNDH